MSNVGGQEMVLRNESKALSVGKTTAEPFSTTYQMAYLKSGPKRHIKKFLIFFIFLLHTRTYVRYNVRTIV